jgi:hypothetical protein
MKVIVPFDFSVDGLSVTHFDVGEQDLPEILLEYAVKNGFVEVDEKKKRGK